VITASPPRVGRSRRQRSFPITVTDDAAQSRYVLRIDGTPAAAAAYLMAQGRIRFTFTELLPGFEGRGLGRQLAIATLDDVRQRGLKVIARCPFFSTFIEDHPQYQDLVDPRFAADGAATA
jgi:predicted GNAT family acetyltransferase